MRLLSQFVEELDLSDLYSTHDRIPEDSGGDGRVRLSERRDFGRGERSVLTDALSTGRSLSVLSVGTWRSSLRSCPLFYIPSFAISAKNPGILRKKNLLVRSKENLRMYFTGWIQSFSRIILWQPTGGL